MPILKRSVIVLLFSVWFTSHIVSQSLTCESAPIVLGLCEMDGLSGSMPESNPANEPMPFCSGGSNGEGNPQNMTWFAFIAISSNATLEFTFTNCQGGLAGVQYGVYTSCTFEEYLPSACQGSAVSINSPVEISLEEMIPGEDYFLFIDGDNGTFCDFSIEVISGGDEDIPDPTSLECISDNCPLEGILCNLGDTITFQTNDTNVVANHIWTINPGPPEGPTGTTTFPDNFASFIFENSGIYEICVVLDNGCTQTNPVCYDLSVFPDADDDGTCDANDLCPNGPEPGTACDDGDDTTENDMITADCECVGEDPNALEEVSLQYSIYPNPTNFYVNIEMEGTFNVQVLTIDGSLKAKINGARSTTIDISSLPSGVYLVKIEQRGKMSIAKLVKI